MISTKINVLTNLFHKNLKFIINSNSDLKTIFNIDYFLKSLGNQKIILDNEPIKIYNDISIYYRSNLFIKNLKNIHNFLFLGCFPRFELSICHLHFKQILNKNFSNFYLIGNWNDWTFKINQKGVSFKTLYIYIKGKNLMLKRLKLKLKLYIFTNINKFINIYNSINLNYINKILIKKNFLFINKLNNFNIIESNNSIINFNEFNYLNKNIINLKINKECDELHLLNIDKELSINKSESIFYTSYQNNNIIKNIKQIKLPISMHFEKKTLSLNLEGSLLYGNKVTSILNKSIKNLDILIEVLYLIKDEFNFKIFDLINFFNIKNKNKRLKNFNKNKNFEYYIKKFLNNNYIFNFHWFNKTKTLYSFYNLYNIIIFKKLNSNFFTYKNKIDNFYKNDILSKNSVNMLMSTYFNKNNSILPLLQNYKTNIIIK